LKNNEKVDRVRNPEIIKMLELAEKGTSRGAESDPPTRRKVFSRGGPAEQDLNA
jgi:hypothetical protein